MLEYFDNILIGSGVNGKHIHTHTHMRDFLRYAQDIVYRKAYSID